MLSIEVIDNFEGLLKLEPIWNDLLAQSDMDCPFLTFEWISCWWNSFGERSELLILVIKEREEIVGIAPLMRTKFKIRGFPVKAITFIANYHSNRAGFILKNNKAEIVHSVLKHLINSNYKYDLIFLEFVEKQSATEKSLNEVLSRNKILFKKMQGGASPYILINKDWESYFKERTKNLRDDIKYRYNLLQKNGKYEILKYSKNNLQEVYADLLSISRNTWQYRNHTAIASDSKNIKFYESLAEVASIKGWLNLYILKFNETPICFEYILSYKERVYLLKIGLNEKYKRYSPGILLLKSSIQDAFVHKKKEYDLLGGNDAYKMRWTSLCRGHCKYLIFNRTFYGRFLWFIELKIIAKLKQIKSIVETVAKK